MANSSFYDQIVSGALNVTEKMASTDKDVEKVLKSLADDQIEALAEEIGAITKHAETETAEEKATNNASNQEGQAEKDLKQEADTPTTDGTESEDAQKQKAESEANHEVKEEEAHEDAKKEEAKSPTPADSRKDDSQYEISASELLENILKEGAAQEEIQEIIETKAFEMAEGILKEANFGIEGFVKSRIANPQVAEKIIEKAKKLAAVTGKPILQIANDLIANMQKLMAR
jgi:cobalamin biosynthesis protein CobT